MASPEGGLAGLPGGDRRVPTEGLCDPVGVGTIGVPGDGIRWQGASLARWPTILAGAMVVWPVLLVALVPAAWPALITALCGALFVLPFRRIEVVVAEAGVQVAYGDGGWIRQRFGLERIDGASVEPASAWWRGGLGYRGSLRLLRWARSSNRAGPCLHLRLDGDRSFIVSVDAPDAALGALVALGVPEDPGR